MQVRVDQLTIAAVPNVGGMPSPSWLHCRMNVTPGCNPYRIVCNRAPQPKRLQAICDLDIGDLQAVEPPRGFGRD